MTSQSAREIAEAISEGVNAMASLREAILGSSDYMAESARALPALDGLLDGLRRVAAGRVRTNFIVPGGAVERVEALRAALLAASQEGNAPPGLARELEELVQMVMGSRAFAE